MKKIFLMAAFAGMLGTSALAGNPGDDKNSKKKECKKTEKSCAGEKQCSKEKQCCKKQAQAAADKPAPAENKTDKKS